MQWEASKRYSQTIMKYTVLKWLNSLNNVREIARVALRKKIQMEKYYQE
jgi:hypothetical protein